MNLSINTNIRVLRKKMMITQEQLAEALGVSCGAVSKWESGLAYPDIEKIVDLANFFEVSVDVLLGYEWQSQSLGRMTEKLKRFTNEKKYEQGILEAEKALQKYPNNFDIIFQSAMLFYLDGLERRNRAELLRAKELFLLSLSFLSQNTDEDISESYIQFRIGEILMACGDYEVAVEHLKKHNTNSINSCSIGGCLIALEKYEDAFPYLSESLISSFGLLFRTVISLSTCYASIKKYEIGLSCFDWLEMLTSGLKKPGKISFLDKFETIIYTGKAIIHEEMGDLNSATVDLQKAWKLAKDFDASPDYDCRGMRFYSGKEHQTFDALGKTAMEGVSNLLTENLKKDSALHRVWEEIQGREAYDK